MKKISTVQAYGKEILKEQKLTIGVDLGDRWSDRTGDRNTFPVGKPAVNGVGTRSDRGARTKSAIDHQEQSKR